MERGIKNRNIKIGEGKRALNDDVAIELIRSIKEIVFKLIDYKYQSTNYLDKNL